MFSVIDAQVELQTFPIRMRSRGQITLPQELRDDLKIDAGDILSLVRIEDMLFLTPKRLRVSEVADQFVAMMEKKGVTLADLLQGLDEVREEIWKERHP